MKSLPVASYFRTRRSMAVSSETRLGRGAPPRGSALKLNPAAALGRGPDCDGLRPDAAPPCASIRSWPALRRGCTFVLDGFIGCARRCGDGSLGDGLPGVRGRLPPLGLRRPPLGRRPPPPRPTGRRKLPRRRPRRLGPFCAIRAGRRASRRPWKRSQRVTRRSWRATFRRRPSSTSRRSRSSRARHSVTCAWRRFTSRLGELDQATVVLETAERFTGGDARLTVQTLGAEGDAGRTKSGALADANLAWSAYALLGRAGGPALGDALMQQAVQPLPAPVERAQWLPLERQALHRRRCASASRRASPRPNRRAHPESGGAQAL